MAVQPFEALKNMPDGPEGKANALWSPYTATFNLTRHPAASVPCGLSSTGLPVGLQIVGPPRADHLVLRAMRAYESASGWTWPQAKVLEALAKM